MLNPSPFDFIISDTNLDSPVCSLDSSSPLHVTDRFFHHIHVYQTVNTTTDCIRVRQTILIP